MSHVWLKISFSSVASVLVHVDLLLLLVIFFHRSSWTYISPAWGFHNHIQLDTPQCVRLFWMRDRPIAETFTWQHTTLKRDRRSCHRRNSNPQSKQAIGCSPRLRPPSHWGRPCWYWWYTHVVFYGSCPKEETWRWWGTEVVVATELDLHAKSKVIFMCYPGIVL